MMIKPVNKWRIFINIRNQNCMPFVSVFIIQNNAVFKKMCEGFVSRYRIDMTAGSLLQDQSNTNFRGKILTKSEKSEGKKSPG